MALLKVELWNVHMRRKSKDSPGEWHTKDVTVQARNTTQALAVAKQVNRGYSLVHVVPITTLGEVWKEI